MSASLISDHPFQARAWWERCAVCHLSMAAHEDLNRRARITRDRDLLARIYRCPDCVWASEYRRPPVHPGGCPRHA